MTIPNYSTGTVSVSANGTVVSGGSSVIWASPAVKEGDWIAIDGLGVTMILEVTDNSHLVIPPWKGGAKTNVPYVIYNNFNARADKAQIASDLVKQVTALNVEGFIWYVASNLSAPDPSRGDEGQWAYQPSTGKQWHKEGGAWVYTGLYKPFGVPAPDDNAKTYSLNDVATSSGSSYVWINPTPGAGRVPPNATYWALLASKGDKGDKGDLGPTYGGTSTTSLIIGTGSKAFTTQANLAYTNGVRVRASSSANTSNWMEGVATYSGTALSITVDKTNGSGTFASWNFNIAGQPGVGDVSSINNLSDLADKSIAKINLGIIQFDSRAIAVAATIPGFQKVVEVLGYYKPGDGGKAVYVEAASQPSHAGWFASNAGTRFWEIAEPFVIPAMFGAKGNYIEFSGLVTTSVGVPGVTITNANFASDDVGKYIGIPGAGASGGVLFSTIATVVSPTQITLANNPGTAKSAVSTYVCMGTDDTAAINACLAFGANYRIPVQFRSVQVKGVVPSVTVGFLVSNLLIPGHPTTYRYNTPIVSGTMDCARIVQRGDIAIANANDILTIGSGVINDTGDAMIGNLYFETMCHVPKVGGYMVYAQGTSRTTLHNLYSIDGSMFHGIGLRGVDNHHIKGVQIRSNKGNGLIAWADSAYPGAGLWIDKHCNFSHAVFDGIRLGGGLGGVYIDAYIQDAGRYGVNIDIDGFSSVTRNREVYIGGGAQIDNAVSCNVYVGPNSVWHLHANDFTNNGNKGFVIEDQGVILASDFLGAFNWSGAFISINNVHNLAGSGHCIEYKDAGNLMIKGCKIGNRFGSSSGIYFNSARQNLANITAVDNQIFNYGGFGMVTNGQPKNAIIANNIINTSMGSGAFGNITNGGAWIVDNNRTV